MVDNTEHDPVSHPRHYQSDATCDNCGESIECIQVVRHHQFARGNAIKYLWRAGAKGDLVEDLKKAIWYIEEEIAQAEGRPNPNVHRLSKGGPVDKWMEANKPGVTIENNPPVYPLGVDHSLCTVEFMAGQVQCVNHDTPLNPAAEITVPNPNGDNPGWAMPFIKQAIEENIQHDLCAYAFEQGEYLCMTHGMKETKHHPRKGADRPCLTIDPE